MAAPELAWNPLFLVGLTACLAGLVFGAYLFSARPMVQNRALGGFLMLFGLGELMSASRFLFVSEVDAYAAWAGRYAMMFFVIATIVVFYSTLPTPWMRPLRSAWARGAVLAFALGLTLLGVSDPLLLGSGMERDAVHGVWLSRGDGPLWAPALGALLLVLVAGPFLTESARRHAHADEERRKLRLLSIAFGVYAGLQGAVLVAVAFFTGDAGPLPFVLNFLAIPLANTVLVVLLAYGVLRAQLFGAELRLKWTLSRGTTAALFIGVFFVASEAAQRVFEARYGPVFGLAGAGLLVFALAPLQRAADSLADRAMPQVRDTTEYREQRARGIYRAALESAARDGTITDRERDLLATLQVELAIPATEALAMEREAVRGSSGALS